MADVIVTVCFIGNCISFIFSVKLCSMETVLITPLIELWHHLHTSNILDSCHQGHVSSKTLLEQDHSVLNRGYRLTWDDVCKVAVMSNSVRTMMG